ncbi:MAG: hypothetical protein JRI96_13560 [Deltaproteobacteria bacterium]|nr:hypothetical protein [Deltaproteobacteria bacterium]
MDLSQCRLRFRKSIDEPIKLLPIFLGKRLLIKGGVYQTKTKCGNKGCKCEREGKLHVVWRFYRSNKGKTEIRTLKKGDVTEYKRFTQNYRRFRWARARLVKIHREQIKLLNFLEQGLRREERSKGR